MKRISLIILAILLLSIVFAVTSDEIEVEETFELSNLEILGIWEFDNDASQHAAQTEAEKKLVRSYNKLRFYFQEDGSVEMAGGEVGHFTQVSKNKFEIIVDDTTLTFTLADDKLYAEIPISKTNNIYPVFTKHKNN